MANEHNFDITIVEERSFDLTTGTPSDLSDSHSFSTAINNRNLFDIIIDGASTLTSWLVRMVQGITIAFTMTCSIAFTSTIKLKRIVISALSSLTWKFVSEVKLKRILINAPMKQTTNNPVTIALKRIIITPVMIMLWGLGLVDISIPAIVIVANSIVGEFYPLWAYDPQDLWEMDGVSLGDLYYLES